MRLSFFEQKIHKRIPDSVRFAHLTTSAACAACAACCLRKHKTQKKETEAEAAVRRGCAFATRTQLHAALFIYYMQTQMSSRSQSTGKLAVVSTPR